MVGEHVKGAWPGQNQYPSLGFISARVRLSAAELRYGYEQRLIDATCVVALADHVRGMDSGHDADVLEQLSYLLSDELDKVDGLVLQLTLDTSEAVQNVWIFLAVSWIDSHRDIFDDPFDAIENLAADFEYPQQLLPLIKFMPVPAGEEPGPRGLQNRLQRYLRKAAESFGYVPGDNSSISTEENDQPDSGPWHAKM